MALTSPRTIAMHGLEDIHIKYNKNHISRFMAGSMEREKVLVIIGDDMGNRGLKVSGAGSSRRRPRRLGKSGRASSSRMLNGMPRFILLEHTGAPDDPTGRHFDLLLEAGDACRTWRLPQIPEPGAPPVAAVEIPPHRLAWLDHDAGEVSGGRGFARRVDAGTYAISMSDAADILQMRQFVIAITGRSSTWPLRFVRHDETWIIAAAPECFPDGVAGR